MLQDKLKLLDEMTEALKEVHKMIDLNELKKKTLEIGKKRIENGAKLSSDFLKHCGGELVEAVIARELFIYSDIDKHYERKAEYASELADIIICVLNEAELADIDIEEAIYDCVEKNERRAEKIGDKL